MGERCPKCGNNHTTGFEDSKHHKCWICGYRWPFDNNSNTESSYDDFVNEMYKLRNSLYEAGFRDKEERAHILGGMASTIYNRTETEKARKTVESMPGLDGKPGSGGLGGSGWG